MQVEIINSDVIRICRKRICKNVESEGERDLVDTTLTPFNFNFSVQKGIAVAILNKHIYKNQISVLIYSSIHFRTENAQILARFFVLDTYLTTLKKYQNKITFYIMSQIILDSKLWHFNCQLKNFKFYTGC